ncbi:putative sulfate exporter family transporter [Belnapia sp. T18]|uniref:Sulfate exporter family transporter n=1 Tax=Belnapia arida TaxID=2804533 RepID=A0ABS1U6M5_9PROT|nr:putative sulfate exporter family transporter [Belnapia arida]MBL6079584.1 putative sulfate exporter family transporter [Belnapia arida]
MPSLTFIPAASRVVTTTGPTRLLPGLALCLAVTLAALALERVEAALFGRAWLEVLVLAIIFGAVLRTAWAPGKRWQPGIAFGARTLLEVAVVLLGASVSAAALLAVGPALLLAIFCLVALAVLGGYAIGRGLGLPRRMAILVACGNAVCGNSAIAAVAPVIGADAEEVASSIAFTAVLGVLVVLGLPLLAVALGLSALQTGALAGLTVYAVPQVLAAAAPAGTLAIQLGTLIKLVRVLMLGPVVLVLSLLAPRLREDADAPFRQSAVGDRAAPGCPPRHRLVPWFILGFLGLATLRSFGLVPAIIQPALASLAGVLTVVSMAALGLGVDVRMVARAGGRVTAAVSLSLLALGLAALGLIRLLGIA